jgi:hypothetical protein
MAAHPPDHPGRPTGARPPADHHTGPRDVAQQQGAIDMNDYLNLPAPDGAKNLDCLSEVILKNLEAAHRVMAQYCRVKASAQWARRTGHVQSATRLEGECDRLYAQLPHAWRW